jgi:hypothetical protein
VLREAKYALTIQDIEERRMAHAEPPVIFLVAARIKK